MRRMNGSIIGPRISTSSSNGSGLWGIDEAFTKVLNSVWPTLSYQVSILLAAGGGGGSGGGGGAGGLVITTATVNRSTYSITIGSGGSAARDGGNTIITGNLLTNITALGGGAAGYNTYGTPNSGNDGHAGGSGGGAGQWNAGGVATYPGAATQPNSQWGGYGNAGSNASPYNRTGCGGGAGGAPTVNTGTGQNNGGIGLFSSITGTSTMYCAGGSVNAYYVSYDTTGAGASNTGNGGGLYSAGGSGVLIISYKAIYQQGSGGVVTSYVDGNSDTWWVHQFNSDGTYTG